MFLALKEMKDAKLKYTLLTGIIFLIATVVFFLAGLANGLASGFRQGIESWKATGVILNREGNHLLDASRLTLADMDSFTAEKKAGIGVVSQSLNKIGKQEKENITIYGIEKRGFLLPTIIKGSSFTKDNELVAPESLAKKMNLKIGDQVHIGNLTHALTVVGLTTDLTHSLSPVFYTNLETFNHIKFGHYPKNKKETQLNAIVVKDRSLKQITIQNNHLEKLSSQTLIRHLPGYNAQNLTLDTMIYVLIVIAASIIGIFMYVLTMQKKTLFGILKAQGIPTKWMVRSVLAQSFLMSFLATLLSFSLVYSLSFSLPSEMPFTVDSLKWLLYGSLLIFMATVGSLFSLPSIFKIDPIVAIGG